MSLATNKTKQNVQLQWWDGKVIFSSQSATFAMKLSECFEFVETFQKFVSDLLLFYFFVGSKTLSSGCRLSVFHWIFAFFL